MLRVINKLLTSAQVDDMRQQLQQAQWVNGSQTAGKQAAAIKNNLQLDERSPIAQALGNKILAILAVHPQFISAALPQKVLPPKFNCYQQGGHYGKHVDNAVMKVAATNTQLRTDLSATIFLSRPEEYDGGELCIETEFGQQSIKLNAGDMVLYPASSLHQVTAVNRGARLSAFFWIQSLVRDISQRTLLYELDQSVQALIVDRDRTDSEVKRLTSIYHNLVRLWAET